MTCALFVCPKAWEPLLPSGVQTADVRRRDRWDLLALTEEGCVRWRGRRCACRLLLLPGDGRASLPDGLTASCVVTYGLSPQNSLTLSSLNGAGAVLAAAAALSGRTAVGAAGASAAQADPSSADAAAGFGTAAAAGCGLRSAGDGRNRGKTGEKPVSNLDKCREMDIMRVFMRICDAQ